MRETTTLTLRNGKRALARLLLEAWRLGELKGGKSDEVKEARAVEDAAFPCAIISSRGIRL
jgi:hypothetical protein